MNIYISTHIWGIKIQNKFNVSNTDGSFILADSNSFLSLKEILSRKEK